VTIAGLSKGEVVLDLGSGAGLDCFLAAQQVGESGHVIGVDMTPEMIEKARSNQLKLGYQNVEFRHGQIESLPVDDESVDVIMSNCVINLSPDKAAVFREAYRVLKPGGRISVSDIVTEGEFSDEHRSDLEAWAECVSGAIELSKYTGMMEQVGFQELIIHSQDSAGEMLPLKPGMPRVLQARITARKGFPLGDG
jgi:SAM-dependent methyltransferase